MSDRNDGWSDLQRAKEASRRLGGMANAGPPRSRGAEPTRSYTRFRGPKASPPAPAPTSGNASPAGAVPAPTLPAEVAKTWTGLLTWACEATASESAFVVDSQGFVLAHQGNWSYEDIEDVGSQLTLIMTRADETESAGRSRSISLEFGQHWLNGTRLEFGGVGELTFVLLSQDPLDRALVTAVSRQVEDAMQRI